MQDCIDDWILDFLNLIFGNGEETSSFWEEVLYAEVAAYYGYSYEELRKSEKNLNALYFNLIEQIGLRVKRKFNPEDLADQDGGYNPRRDRGFEGANGVS